MPEPRGKDTGLIMYLDSNYAGDKSMCISRPRLLIYMNMDLIQWLSNEQLTIETSVFGAELWK